MDIRIRARTMDLLNRLCVRGERKVAQIPYAPQKTESFLGKTPTPYFERVTPESVGVDSNTLSTLLGALEDDRETNLHNLVILRGGKMILSASAPGYRIGLWSLTHSMAKTVTSFAIGCLIGEGKLSLDRKITDIFAGRLPMIVFPRMRKVTVRNLLTMSSGVTAAAEVTSVTEEKWLTAFLESAPSFEPGSRFHYNSMNSYVLGAIVHEVSGEELFDYLKKRVFAPLGIPNVFWEKSPEGESKGGWGLYISPEDMAKLGQLMLRGGVWEGRQILPAEYLREATSPQFHTASGYGDYDYGFHLWVARDGSSYLFNGMLGQNISVCPETDTVAVSTTGNREFYQQSTTLRMITAAMKSLSATPKRLPENRRAYRALTDRIGAFFARRSWIPPLSPKYRLLSPPARPLPEECRAILGTYVCRRNNIGLLPLFTRMMQNNYSEGISSVTFSREGERLLVTVMEGKQVYRFFAGFYDFEETELDFSGERYLVSVMAGFAENEDGERLLKLELLFPETPHTRRIKCYFHHGSVRFLFSETPGVGVLNALLSSMAVNSPKKPLLLNFAQQQLLNRDYVMMKIRQNLEPVLSARREPTPPLLSPTGNS